jgi:hypothetical protein
MRDAPIYALTSVTKLDESHAGAVIVAGSHGGIYPGYLAAKAHVRAIILNDAGVGFAQAGIGSLAYLDALRLPAATASHETARIGDGHDMLLRGVTSHVNRAARDLGARAGLHVKECAALLRRAAPTQREPEPYAESRFLLRDEPGEPKVWGLDSVSLVRPQDAGHVVVTGSHGGLLAGEQGSALKVDALAALFNDAGVGIDNAGISRLPTLDARGIAAATLDHKSCKIGDARSAWTSGVVSFCNDSARALGAKQGMSATQFARLVIGARVV